jgi:hypothetical protein
MTTYERGWIARARGARLVECPRDASVSDQLEWCRGWHECELAQRELDAVRRGAQ